MISAREQLLADIEAFMARHQMFPTQFGREVMNDTAFINKLRRGRSVELETAERIRKFMREYKPTAKRRVQS